MSTNPQTQSPFTNRLPREIRDAIYHQLWSSGGLRQHIFWHGDPNDKHFCHWPCITDYHVKDELQQDIEELRVQLDIPLGQDLNRKHHERATLYGRRLQSPWINHWLCGERAFDQHGLKTVWGPHTSTLACLKGRGRSNRSRTYMPMLLLCKLISAECLRSIYESTTFIFTDLVALQMFLGHCALPLTWKAPTRMGAIPKLGITPPAFFKYARSLELSLSADFPKLLMCANLDLPGFETRHDVYDFHWLRLDKFRNLSSVNIWISARSITCRMDSDNSFLGIKQLDVNALTDVLNSFKSSGSVTVSTPLGSSMGPEEGYVKGVAPPNVRLYQRGCGDKFHPFLNMIELDSGFDGVIHTSVKSEVRLAQNGGNYDVMKDM